MLKKLRIRFILINMGIVTVLLLTVFLLIWHFMNASLKRESGRLLHTIAHDSPKRMPPDRRQNMLPPFFALFLDEQGNILKVEGDLDFYDLSDQAFLERTRDLAFASGGESGRIREYHLRYLLFPVSDRDSAQKLVFLDVSNEERILKHLAITLSGSGLLAFSLFLLVSFLLARWAVMPAQKAWEEQKRFVADASHELKTPLTVIIANAELLIANGKNLETGKNEEWAKMQEYAENIRTMSLQMKRLTESLLSLVRADRGIPKNTFSRLDFSLLTEEALLPFEPLFFEKGLTLSSDITSEIFVSGVASSLQELLELLLENALKYALRGDVRLALVKKTKKTCLLSLSNECGEIQEADLKNIFKRFYRMDKARNERTNYGLGLPIAYNIVKSHGGKILAEYKDGRISFLVSLPVS